ncbi:MAG: phosphoribosylglycinamide formyltransferase [Fibrobacterota bacterium]
MRCAVFASGGGSNFQVLAEQLEQSPAEIVLLISNNSTSGAMQRAQKLGIPAVHISGRTHPDSREYTAALTALMKEYNVDTILLAGYMKRLPADLIAACPERILNIHPALLPAFGGRGMYGIHIHRAVIDAGVKKTGVTVHFVNEEYDRGRIITQVPVPVYTDDTPEKLAQRVLAVEHDTYWRVVDRLARGHSLHD